MSVPDRLPDEAIDGLLDGSPAEEAAGTPLAAFIADLRTSAQTVTPTPSEELQAVLAEGLDPAELGAAAPATGLTWRVRGRTIVRTLVTKFAALGLLGKAAAAGAAVTVAASGAGAAGVLPDSAQVVFDDLVPIEGSADVEDDDGDQQSEEPTAEDVPAGDAPDTPADTASTPPLETDVSDDATGSDDGEPGVDGGDVAEDASDGQARVPADRPAEKVKPRPEESSGGSEAVEEAPADAPAEDTPASDRPTPRPDASSEPDDGDAEGR